MSLIHSDDYKPRRDPKPITTQEEFLEEGNATDQIRKTFASLTLQNNPIAENEDMETTSTQDFIATYIQIVLILGTYALSIGRKYSILLNGVRIANYNLSYVGGATSATRLQEKIDLEKITIKKGDVLRIETTGGAPFPDEEGYISLVLGGFSL